MSLDCGRKLEYLERGEHANTTQEGPSRPVDLNPEPSYCDMIVLTTAPSSHRSMYCPTMEIQCVYSCSDTGRWSEIIKRGEMWYCLNMGITVHIFRQSLLESIHGVALGCSHEKWLNKVTEMLEHPLIRRQEGVGAEGFPKLSDHPTSTSEAYRQLYSPVKVQKSWILHLHLHP